jgi:molecular chaperone DnaK
MGYTVGIDFGMTRSAVAHVPTDRTRPAIIHNSEGEPTTPSAVYYGESGETLVGTPARDNGILKPDRYVDGIKRHLGRDVTFDLGGRSRTPEEIAARIID